MANKVKKESGSECKKQGDRTYKKQISICNWIGLEQFLKESEISGYHQKQGDEQDAAMLRRDQLFKKHFLLSRKKLQSLFLSVHACEGFLQQIK